MLYEGWVTLKMTLFHKTKNNIQKAREKRKKIVTQPQSLFLVLDEQNFYFLYQLIKLRDLLS